MFVTEFVLILMGLLISYHYLVNLLNNASRMHQLSLNEYVKSKRCIYNLFTLQV